jgi:long-chain acyl-CoA synthetase
MMERFVERTGAHFYQGYGLTEAGPSTHCTPIEGDPNYRSVGLAFPDTDVKIVDLKLGEFEMPTGEKGELLIRGPQVMKGYWRAPRETAQTLKAGWLHTGDICWIDDDGYMYVAGRKRDRILAGGHTIWPRDVEEVLTSHPYVKEAIAIGVPDPLRCSSDIQALVTLMKKGGEGLEDELLDHCRKRLKYFQVPAKIILVDSLPKTPMGKVDRLAVETEVERRIQEEIARYSNQRSV